MSLFIIRTILLHLLSTAVNLSESCSEQHRRAFHQTVGLDCVNASFTQTVPGLCTPLECSIACARKNKCQAFRLLTDSACQCKLFLFDACSHRVQSVPSCTRQVTVYVRSLPGLPPGRLCPPGYEHTLHGTAYKLVSKSPATWANAHLHCNLDPGLTKLADAIDTDEAAYLMRLTNLSLTTPEMGALDYYLGGSQASANTIKLDGWRWADCNLSISQHVWDKGKGQPDNGFPDQACTALFSGFTNGIDDFACDSTIAFICECQQVF